MEKKDIIFQNDKNWPYAVMADIWGKTLKIQIMIEGFTVADDELESMLRVIEKRLAFLNSARSLVEQTLIEEDAVSMANDWAESAEPSDEDDVYIMEDGTKVRLPMTEEYFLSTILIDEVAIEFTDSLEDVETTFYVICNPDFFAGHAFVMTLDAENEIDGCLFCG